MATSPNFNWPEPDNTDLVKNGALAIRTAVNAIDSSLVDLKGGTTGQVLAKASGTDMDFSWVAQDDANAIQNTQLTAKGALISAVSAGTPATLTVGANDTVLTADSTTATGLKWATPAGSIPANDYALVSAFEGTTSTSYTNLATAGPAVTVTTGTKALVIVSANIVNSTNNNSLQAWMSYAVSGATTTSASDTWALAVSGIQSVAYQMKMSLASVATLTAGSNTFTARYRATSGTSEFGNRSITVINLA